MNYDYYCISRLNKQWFPIWVSQNTQIQMPFKPFSLRWRWDLLQGGECSEPLRGFVGLANRLTAVHCCLVFPALTTNCGLEAAGKNRPTCRQTQRWQLLLLTAKSQTVLQGKQAINSSSGPLEILYKGFSGFKQLTEMINSGVTHTLLHHRLV